MTRLQRPRSRRGRSAPWWVAAAWVALPLLGPPATGIPAAAQEAAPAADTAAVQQTTAAVDTAEAETPAGSGALRVFLDCQTFAFCDRDFLRREIEYVDFVRDREAAQVHVLITSQATGGGGRQFSLDFVGRERFDGLDDRIEFSVRANIAEERALDRLARRVQLGLARYAARLPSAPDLRITLADGGEELETTRPEDDPWNFWVFDVGLRAGLQGQERTSSISLSGDVAADRVTEDLKIELEVDGRYQESDFEVNDTTTVTSITRRYEAEGLVVWSLGPHWSVGGQASAEHSSFRNRDLALRVAPGLEYNLFPYEESERRQLSFLYTVGPEYFVWREETIFGETSEWQARQRLEVSLDVRQPWGSAGSRVEASTFLSDLERHRLQFFGNLRFRIFQGLSLDLFGRIARVQDQINLPRGEASEEEVLLRIRELQTDFEYSLSVGFGYTFGSIFSNVVNPRF